MSAEVLQARGLEVRTPSGRTVLERLDLDLHRGEALGLVGVSGGGKSTLLRALLGLQRPTTGRVSWRGAPLPTDRAGLRLLRRAVQYVPQDPVGSLDPRLDTVSQIRAPLRALRVPGDHTALVARALDTVELPASTHRSRPAELSGGQAQRVALARALAVGADTLLADEPLSSLDRPLRASMLRLLHHLHHRHGLTLLLVSHDLGAVAELCPRTAVLDEGRIVEQGATRGLLDDARHPTTRALAAARPRWERTVATPTTLPSAETGHPTRRTS
ncbi:hypothetical protein GCM10027425_20250 [Alteromonas gracilis]